MISTTYVKENLEKYFTENDNTVLTPISRVFSQFYSSDKKFERELALELPFLDYRIAKKCYSIISNNPNIQKRCNLEKINELIDDWLSICKIVNESFKRNYPKLFQAARRNIIPEKIAINTIEVLSNTLGEESLTIEGYKKYGYTEEQAKTMIQQEKRRKYVSLQLKNKNSDEKTLQYIDEYLISAERKKIRETFFKIMHEYKLFDSSITKTNKFNYRIIVPLAILGVAIGFFFLVLVISAIIIG